MLGTMLREKRRAAKRSMQEIAADSDLSYSTVWTLENGGGNMDSFCKVLTVLGLELAGRNLPEGTHLGHQLKVLRQRRKLSMVNVYTLVQVSKPALITLEAGNLHRVETLEKVARVLGAGLYLKPVDAAKAFYNHAGNSFGQNNWTTPKWLIDRLTPIFGQFDLDPCAPNKKPVTGAKVAFTLNDDGLTLAWFGATFLNPPYGRALGEWMQKATREYQAGHVSSIVALVPARTDTIWWHRSIAAGVSVVFLKGRLKFGDGEQSAPFPSALLIWGASASQLQTLRASFPDSWIQAG